MMFCIYKAKHPFFEQYRSEPDRKFPWEEDSSKWNSLLRKNVLLLILNILFFAPLVGVLITPDIDNVPTRHDLDSWPSLWEIVWQVAFCSFCEDFMFYCTHRTLHTRWCYKHIHKRHHEYAQPVSIGSEFSHPLEFLFGNVLPFQFPIILLDRKMHEVTLLVWGIYRLFETGDAHSGYDFPWSPFRLIPFSSRVADLTLSPCEVSQLPPHSQQGQLRYFLRFLGHALWDEQELLRSSQETPGS